MSPDVQQCQCKCIQCYFWKWPLGFSWHKDNFGTDFISAWRYIISSEVSVVYSCISMLSPNRLSCFLSVSLEKRHPFSSLCAPGIFHPSPSWEFYGDCHAESYNTKKNMNKPICLYLASCGVLLFFFYFVLGFLSLVRNTLMALEYTQQ